MKNIPYFIQKFDQDVGQKLLQHNIYFGDLDDNENLVILSDKDLFIIEKPLTWYDQLNQFFSQITLLTFSNSAIQEQKSLSFMFLFRLEFLIEDNQTLLHTLLQLNQEFKILSKEKTEQHNILLDNLKCTYIDPINISMFQYSFNKYVSQHKNELKKIIKQQYQESCQSNADISAQQVKNLIQCKAKQLAKKKTRIQDYELYLNSINM